MKINGKFTRRFVSLVLAMAFVFTLLPVTALAAETDTALTPGSSYPLTGISQAEPAWFTITPAADESYRIYSSGDMDTFVEVYQGDATQRFDYDDEGAQDRGNFLWEGKLTGGTTYRFKVFPWNPTRVGDTTVHFEQLVPATAIAINGATDGKLTLPVGLFDYKMTVTFAPENGAKEDVTWSSDNEEVLEMDDKWLYAMKAGTATLTATSENGLTASVTVTVVDPPALTLDTPVNTAVAAGTDWLVYSFTPAESGEYVFWTEDIDLFDDHELFAADGTELDGVDTDIGDEEFFLATLTAGETYYYYMAYDEKTATDVPTSVWVEKAMYATGIEIAGDDITTIYVENMQFDLDLITTPANALPEEVEWTSSDPEIAEVNSDGYVYGYGVGTVTITATSLRDETITDSITVTLNEPPALTAGKASLVKWSDAVNTYAFTFTPETSGNYLLHMDGGKVEMNIEDEDGNWVDRDSMTNSLIVVTLEADTTYSLKAAQQLQVAETSFMIEPQPAATGFDLEDGMETLNLALGDYIDITPMAIPAGSALGKLTYTCDEDILEVDEEDDGDFEITGIAPGTTTFTVTNEAGESDSIVVTVLEPMKWEGEGTKTVLFNADYPVRTFALTVEETATYCIESATSEYDPGMELYDADGSYIDDADDDVGYNFKWIGELTADTVYYLLLYSYDNEALGAGYDVRITKTEEEAADDEAFAFGKKSIDLALGYWWDVWFDNLPEEDGVTTLTSSNEKVAMIDEGMVVAVSVGTATITATTASGLTATMTVTVPEPTTLTMDTPAKADINYVQQAQCFTFVVPADGEYVVRSFDSAGDPRAALYDSKMNYIDDDDDTDYSYNFWMQGTLKAGETYYLLVRDYEYAPCQVVVTTASKATAVTLGLAGYGYIAHDGDTYYFDADGEPYVYANVLFGEGYGAREQAYTLTVSDTSVAMPRRNSSNGLYILGSGTTEVTITTEKGLTDTVTLAVVDAVPADIDGSGKVDAADALAVAAHLNGTATLTLGQQARADLDGDNAVTVADALALFAKIGTDAGEEAPKVTVAVGTTTVASLAVGDTVEVTLSLKDAQDLAVLALDLGYDTEKLELTAASSQALTVSFAATETGAQLVGLSAVGAANATVTLTFKALVDLEEGALPITVADAQAYSAAGAAFRMSGETGGVTIRDALLGDVDGNGKVNTTDARLTLQHAAGRIDDTKLDTSVADVDGNSKVNTTDARLILQKAAKRIDKFPAEKG